MDESDINMEIEMGIKLGEEGSIYEKDGRREKAKYNMNEKKRKERKMER